MSEPKKDFPERMHAFVNRLMLWSKPRKDPRKQENPIFATFQDRMLASAVDLGLIFLLFQDLFNWIARYVYSFLDVERLQQIQQADDAILSNDSNMLVYISETVEAMFASGFADLWLINSAIQSVVMGLILIFLWHEFHLTPGKYIMGLEFAGRNGEGKPTLRQYFLRYLGFYVSMPFLMIGFMAVSIDSQKRAWHDRIAGTTVIYSQRGSIFRQAWDLIKASLKRG